MHVNSRLLILFGSINKRCWRSCLFFINKGLPLFLPLQRRRLVLVLFSLRTCCWCSSALFFFSRVVHDTFFFQLQPMHVKSGACGRWSCWRNRPFQLNWVLCMFCSFFGRGGALFVDYGEAHALGDSLRCFKGHKQVLPCTMLCNILFLLCYLVLNCAVMCCAVFECVVLGALWCYALCGDVLCCVLLEFILVILYWWLFKMLPPHFPPKFGYHSCCVFASKRRQPKHPLICFAETNKQGSFFGPIHYYITDHEKLRSTFFISPLTAVVVHLIGYPQKRKHG